MFELGWLSGLEAAKRQKTVMLTVVRRTGNGWKAEEQLRLCEKLVALISFHPQFPEILILWGEIPKEKIAWVLGTDDFEYRVLEGVDNRELPFRPNFDI